MNQAGIMVLAWDTIIEEMERANISTELICLQCPHTMLKRSVIQYKGIDGIVCDNCKDKIRKYFEPFFKDTTQCHAQGQSESGSQATGTTGKPSGTTPTASDG